MTVKYIGGCGRRVCGNRIICPDHYFAGLLDEVLERTNQLNDPEMNCEKIL